MKFSTAVLSLISVASIASAAPSHGHNVHKKRDIAFVTIEETVTVLNGLTLLPSDVPAASSAYPASSVYVLTYSEAYNFSSSASPSSNFYPESTFTPLTPDEKAVTEITPTTTSTEAPVEPTTTQAPVVEPTTTSTEAPVEPTTTQAPVVEPTTTSTEAPTPTTTEAPVVEPTTTSTEAPAPTTSTEAPQETQTSSGGSSDFASQILAQHNKYRAMHSAPDLTWSDELASYAQNYIDGGNTCESFALTHSGGQYGENLAIGYSYSGTVDAWYGEISNYDFSNPGFSSSTGHFTQVVWKSSTQLGCAYQYCGGEWSNYVVCEYNPAGNFGGEYADNVLEN